MASRVSRVALPIWGSMKTLSKLGKFWVAAGFALKAIKTSGRNMSRLQSLDQIIFNNQGTARRIDDDGAPWQLRKGAGVQYVGGFRGRGAIEGEEFSNG